MLLVVARQDQQHLAASIGLSQSAMSRKMNHQTKWTPDDLVTLAEYFTATTGEQVEPGDFFREPRDLFRTGSR